MTEFFAWPKNWSESLGLSLIPIPHSGKEIFQKEWNKMWWYELLANKKTGLYGLVQLRKHTFQTNRALDACFQCLIKNKRDSHIALVWGKL